MRGREELLLERLVARMNLLYAPRFLMGFAIEAHREENLVSLLCWGDVFGG
jgi:hypothetical protein